MFLFIFAGTCIYCFNEFNRRHSSNSINLRSKLDESYFINSYDFDAISPMFAESLVDTTINLQKTPELQKSSDIATAETKTFNGPSNTDIYRNSADWPIAPSQSDLTDPSSTMLNAALPADSQESSDEHIQTLDYDYKYDQDTNEFVKVLKTGMANKNESVQNESQPIKYADEIKQLYGVDDDKIKLQAVNDDNIDDELYK